MSFGSEHVYELLDELESDYCTCEPNDEGLGTCPIHAKVGELKEAFREAQAIY